MRISDGGPNSDFTYTISINQIIRKANAHLRERKLAKAPGTPHFKEILIVIDGPLSGIAGMNGMHYRKDATSFKREMLYLEEGVSIITSCGPDEPPVNETGELAHVFYQALAGGTGDLQGNVSLIQAYEFIYHSLYFEYGQEPKLRLNSNPLTSLRKVPSRLNVPIESAYISDFLIPYLLDLYDDISESVSESGFPNGEATSFLKSQAPAGNLPWDNNNPPSVSEQLRLLGLIEPKPKDPASYRLTAYGKIIWKSAQ